MNTHIDLDRVVGKFILIEFGVDEEGDIIGESDDLFWFLDDWNKDNQTNYRSRHDFNSGETNYYIKKLSKFTIHYSLTGCGSVEVYARNKQEAEKEFLEYQEVDDNFIRGTCFDSGLEVQYSELEDEGDVFPEEEE